MKIGQAKIGDTYCATEKCSMKKTCKKHKDRWNFSKYGKYSFVDFGEDYCIRKMLDDF